MVEWAKVSPWNSDHSYQFAVIERQQDDGKNDIDTQQNQGDPFKEMSEDRGLFH